MPAPEWVEGLLARISWGAAVGGSWRLSGAMFANRFDGGYRIKHVVRWNEPGPLVTYCATGPAL